MEWAPKWVRPEMGQSGTKWDGHEIGRTRNGRAPNVRCEMVRYEMAGHEMGYTPAKMIRAKVKSVRDPILANRGQKSITLMVMPSR